MRKTKSCYGDPNVEFGPKRRVLFDEESGDWIPAPLGQAYSQEWEYAKGDYRGRIERRPRRVNVQGNNAEIFRVIPEFFAFLRYKTEESEELLGVFDTFEDASQDLQRELEILAAPAPEEVYPLPDWMQTEVY